MVTFNGICVYCLKNLLNIDFVNKFQTSSAAILAFPASSPLLTRYRVARGGLPMLRTLFQIAGACSGYSEASCPL